MLQVSAVKKIKIYYLSVLKNSIFEGNKFKTLIDYE